MTRTVSFRVPDQLAGRLARLSEGWGLPSDSEVYRRIIEEWTRLQDHPRLRFVDGPAGRRAALVDGPAVWEVIAVARDFDFDRERICEAYPWVTGEQLAAAIAYFEAFPEEVEAALERNARAAEELARELEMLRR